MIEADYLVLHQFDPRTPVAGGIDKFIRGLVKFSAPGTRFAILGVDARDDGRRLGEWCEEPIADRSILFMPLTRLHPSSPKGRPHSLHLAAGLLKQRPRVQAKRLHVHMVELGILAATMYPRMLGTQFIHHNWGGSETDQKVDTCWKYARWVYLAIEKLSVKLTKEVIVLNRDRAARLQQISPRVRFSPTWFDPEFFWPEIDRRPSQPLRVLWVGRFAAQKAPALAVRTLAALKELRPDVELTMVGEGRDYETVCKLSHTLGVVDQLKFPGFLPSEQVADRLRASDVFFMTSEFEGFSIALIEALACGTPAAVVQAADPNGVVVEGENGARAVTREPIDIAKSILRAALCRRAACARSVERFAGPAVVSTILGV